MKPDLDIITNEMAANEETVSILERLLVEAKEGRLTSILVCGRLHDNSILTTASQDINCASRIGMLEMLKFNWMIANREEVE